MSVRIERQGQQFCHMCITRTVICDQSSAEMSHGPWMRHMRVFRFTRNSDALILPLFFCICISHTLIHGYRLICTSIRLWSKISERTVKQEQQQQLQKTLSVSLGVSGVDMFALCCIIRLYSSLVMSSARGTQTCYITCDTRGQSVSHPNNVNTLIYTSFLRHLCQIGLEWYWVVEK